MSLKPKGAFFFTRVLPPARTSFANDKTVLIMEKPRQRRKELYPGNRQIGNRVRELFIALPPPKSGNVVNRPFRPGWKREQQEKKNPRMHKVIANCLAGRRASSSAMSPTWMHEFSSSVYVFFPSHLYRPSSPHYHYCWRMSAS